MLNLEVLLGLNSKKSDFVAAFLHVDIPEDEMVHLEIPRGFKNGCKKCYNVKKSLYGLCYIPCDFWNYMPKKLKQSGMKQ